MKTPIVSLFLMAAMAPAAFAQQGARPAVVELYTSQGCSSCPPADAFLAELSQQDGVIALALHVDYWDYIGWKDTFASPDYTNRQYSYARFAGEKMVYTPQMVINGGQEKIVGDDAAGIARLMRPAGGEDGPVLMLSRKGKQVRVQATTSKPFPNGASIELVHYIPSASVDIERGENSGRRILYANVVTSWTSVGQWDGSAPLDMAVNAPGGLPVAVVIQEPGPGAILGAATLR
ncbi:MAG: DUF1223 domain-containing protein [Rhodobacteraceae bacterium]|nr:DUF1223 domain-containing protein [Paracoccaceae bacterium]